MAVKDIKEYYYKMQAQYLEMKADLADFEQDLKNGRITEEQMQQAIDEVQALEVNYSRLTYIMYLLEAPNRRSKKERYHTRNSKVYKALKEAKADEESVIAENKSALDTFRQQLKTLKEKNR